VKVFVFTAIVALAGCGSSMPASPHSSSAGPAPGGSTSNSAFAPLAKHRLLYLANDANVIVYPATENNPPPIRTITAGLNQPAGVAVDSSGTLYVANTQGNNVTEYRAGESTPFRTISSGIDDPEAIAVDANGTVYVGNRNLGAQEVYVNVYPKGSLTPNLTITFPKHNIPHLSGLAVDSAFNLYVLTILNAPAVTRFPSGSTQGTDLGLQGLGAFAEGLAVDRFNNVYTSIASGAINVYAAGATQPKRTISNGLTSPGLFTVTPGGALYVPNQSQQFNGGTVLEFPANQNTPKFTISGFEYPKGTAVH
jgi:serine/threonine-protein kinase